MKITLNYSSLASKLNGMGSKLTEGAEKALKKSSVDGMAVAQEAAPRDNGDLMRSIQLKPLQKKGNTLEGGFDVNIKYAAPQNFGWVDKRTGDFHEGKFFMEAGYEETKKVAKEGMKRAIKNVL